MQNFCFECGCEFDGNTCPNCGETNLIGTIRDNLEFEGYYEQENPMAE